MKVVTKLKLFGVIATFLLIIAGVTFYWRSFVVQEVSRKSDIANEIIGEAFRTNILSADYVVSRTERAVAQWKLQQMLLVTSVASYPNGGPEEQKAIFEIKKWQETSLTHFDQLVAFTKEQESTRSAVPSTEVEQRLIAQLSVDEQNIVTAATTLVKINNARLASVRQITGSIFSVTVVLLGISIILGYFFLVVTISKPIQELDEGARIIASGNLDFRLNVDHRRDEFGALTASFNTMVSKLRVYFEQLKKSELQLRSVYDQTTDILYYMTVEDSIYRFTSVNQSFYKATGLSEDQVIGKLVTEVIPEPSLSLVLGKYKQAIEGKKIVAWEEVTPYPTGTKYGDVTVAPIFDSNGRCTNLIGTVHDITDRKKAEEELKVSQARDEAILQNMGDGVVAVDTNGKIISVNNTTCEMLDFSRSDLEGKSFMDAIVAKDHGVVVTTSRPYYQALTSGITISSGELTFVKKDGNDLAVFTTASPLILDGAVSGVTIVFRDFSKEKEIDIAKSEFVGLASHQLRTPLSVFKWNMETLLSGDLGQLSASQKEYIETSLLVSRGMVELVNMFLDVNRLELGTLQTKPQEVNMAEILKASFSKFKTEVASKNIEFGEEYGAEVTTIQTDPGLLITILENLFSNAVKYTPDNGKISVSTRKSDNDLTISVSDTGLGIPKNQQDKIFTKLFRADNVKSIDPNGRGLGLYIAKTIMTLLGGKIWFESTEGVGTTFYLTLPLA